MIFVIIQFISLGVLIVNINIYNVDIISSVIFLLSIIVGILAILHMKLDNLNITPELKAHHQLITSGIYNYIRHPMYSSLLLFSLAVILHNYNYFTFGASIVLVIDLYLKSQKEEMYLSQKFDEYASYKTHTGRFIPRLLPN